MKPTFKNTHLAVDELLREPPAVPAPETPYLGPATVAAVSHKQVELDHPGGRCTARQYLPRGRERWPRRWPRPERR